MQPNRNLRSPRWYMGTGRRRTTGRVSPVGCIHLATEEEGAHVQPSPDRQTHRRCVVSEPGIEVVFDRTGAPIEITQDREPWSKVPEWLIGAVSATAYLTYGTLACWANLPDGSRPSINTVAKKMGVSRSTVQRGVRELESIGACRIEYRFGDNGAQKASRYHLALFRPAAVEPVDNSKPAGRKGVSSVTPPRKTRRSAGGVTSDTPTPRRKSDTGVRRKSDTGGVADLTPKSDSFKSLSDESEGGLRHMGNSLAAAGEVPPSSSRSSRSPGGLENVAEASPATRPVSPREPRKAPEGPEAPENAPTAPVAPESRYCTRHPEGTPEPCGPCADARRNYDAAAAAAETARKAARVEADRRERTAFWQALDACGYCNSDGFRLDAPQCRCDHTADQLERAGRGSARARAAIAACRRR